MKPTILFISLILLSNNIFSQVFTVDEFKTAQKELVKQHKKQNIKTIDFEKKYLTLRKLIGNVQQTNYTFLKDNVIFKCYTQYGFDVEYLNSYKIYLNFNWKSVKGGKENSLKNFNILKNNINNLGFKAIPETEKNKNPYYPKDIFFTSWDCGKNGILKLHQEFDTANEVYILSLEFDLTNI